MTTSVGRLGRPSRTAALAAVVLASLAGAAAPAAGQSSERPFRGLFGRLPGSSEVRPQSLDFTASLFGGYDDDIFARGTGPREPGRRLGGTYVGGQGVLGYERRTEAARFSATALTAFRWVTDTEELVPTHHGLRLGYVRSLSPRTTLALTQRAYYRPYFSVVPFAAPSTLDPTVVDEDVIDPDIDVPGMDVGAGGPDDVTLGVRRRGVTYAGTASLRRALTPRSSLRFMAGYAVADFGSSFDQVNSQRYRGSFRYSYNLTEYASLRLGYGYRTMRNRLGRRTDNHDVDVGVNYGRPFTFGRGRTTFSVTTGTAMAVRDRLDAEGGSGDRFVLRAVGTAALRHDFVAPWQAQVVYVRSVAFLDGLSEPFSGDRVTASLGGWLGRRTDVLVSAGYLTGSVGLSRRNFDTLLGSFRLRTALTPNIALFTQYFYYQYDFAPELADQLIIAPELERQGVRAGLTIWLPLAR